ncbi:protein DEHYDRATION-INDUCED 19 homolog 5-like isoform X1 [Tasmannia lanceolata]|uniref:protein DEHYDRATION-INDUCED 19 homolog 5-like isoform X1 n=1 Tax=Tasmannia lanceolata TaxID=3420 RepID=UPI0040640976
MDVDFWASRVHSAKHLSATQAARLNSDAHLNLDDSEGDDDVRACFPCPFCYFDIELRVLCTHLEEEHCFDVKNAVCPVCAANLGKDMIGHFTMQHSHLLKRRRKSQRTGPWTNSTAMLSKELRGLSSFLGVASTNGRGNKPESAPDPLLSPFLCGLALPDASGNLEASTSIDARVASDLKSSEPSSYDGAQEQTDEERMQRDKERMQRATFVQQLLLSTIF